jgi:hypothetical protein
MSDFDSSEFETDVEPGLEFEQDAFGVDNSGGIEGVSQNDVEDRHETNLEHGQDQTRDATEPGYASDSENISLSGSYDAESNSITVEGQELQGDQEIIAAMEEQFRQGIDGVAYSTTFAYEGALYQSQYIIEGTTLRIDTVLLSKDEEEILNAEYLYESDDDGEAIGSREAASTEEEQPAASLQGTENSAQAEAANQMETANQEAENSWANIFAGLGRESKQASESAIERAGADDIQTAETGETILEKQELDLSDLFWIPINDTARERITVAAGNSVKESGRSRELNFSEISAEKSVAPGQEKLERPVEVKAAVTLRKSDKTSVGKLSEMGTREIRTREGRTSREAVRSADNGIPAREPSHNTVGEIKTQNTKQLKEKTVKSPDGGRPTLHLKSRESKNATSVPANAEIKLVGPEPKQDEKTASGNMVGQAQKTGEISNLKAAQAKHAEPEAENAPSAIRLHANKGEAELHPANMPKVPEAQKNELPKIADVAEINDPSSEELRNDIKIEAAEVMVSVQIKEQGSNAPAKAVAKTKEVTIENVQDAVILENQVGRIGETGRPVETNILEIQEKPQQAKLEVPSIKQVAEKITAEPLELAKERTTPRKIEQAKQRPAKNIENRQPAIQLVKKEGIRRPTLKLANKRNASQEKNRKVLEFKKREKATEHYALRRTIKRVVRTGPRIENNAGITLMRQRRSITADERDGLKQNREIAQLPRSTVKHKIPGPQRAAIRMAA